MSKDYLATFLCTGDAGEQIANTICVHDDELGGPRGPADVVDYVDTWLTVYYKAFTVASTIIDALRLFQIPAVYGADSEVAVKLLGIAGTLAAGDGKMPRETTLTLSMRSNHTSRRSMGRLLLAGPQNAAVLTSAGNWSTGSTYWAEVGSFGDALLAGHDIGIGGIDGHLSTRIYSRRNHIEGETDKTVDVATYLRRPRPRWLRRRVSIP